MSRGRPTAIFELIDLETGQVVGRMREDGAVIAGDRWVKERVAQAFGRDLLMRDGELIEELGVCFFDVETLYPGEPGHAPAIVRNLGRLTGLIPRRREERA